MQLVRDRWAPRIENPLEFARRSRVLLMRHADVVAVRQWVREFATAMSMSDMLDEFDKVVARSKSTR